MKIRNSLCYPLLWILLFLLGSSGCSTNIPSDFNLIVDARRIEPEAGSPTEHIFLEINHLGKSSYIIYDTGGAITYDSHGMISISRSQILEIGSFRITTQNLEKIWQQIEESHYFELTDDYRMSIGGAYAFLVVSANSRTHSVDNIGMELSEIDGIIEIINHSLQDQFKIQYSMDHP